MVMKKDLVHLVFILDKSGSMSGLQADTIGGFNSLIEKQKSEEGEAIVTTVLFNDDYFLVHDKENIDKVKELTRKEYFPIGCTALLDAVGRTVSAVASDYEMMNKEDIPERTLVVITTDGKENSSKEYSYFAVKSTLEKAKELYNFEYLFLGANIDSIEEASKFGIHRDNAVNYNCDSEGVELNYQCLSRTVSRIRKEKLFDASWKKDIEEDYFNR